MTNPNMQTEFDSLMNELVDALAETGLSLSQTALLAAALMTVHAALSYISLDDPGEYHSPDEIYFFYIEKMKPKSHQMINFDNFYGCLITLVDVGAAEKDDRGCFRVTTEEEEA